MHCGRPTRGAGNCATSHNGPAQSEHGATRGALGGGYSRSSAYEPMARAMSAWAQNRWYVNDGTAPPFR